MSFQIQENVVLITKECPVCGITYAAPKRFFDYRNEGEHENHHWFCPNGHRLIFIESDLVKAQKELAAQRRMTAEAQAETSRERQKRLEGERRAKKE